MSKRVMAYVCGFVFIGFVAAQAGPIFSSKERTEGLLEGKGMGLAMPAENNGYPGPRHVLDAAEKLHLTPDQKADTEALVAAMKSEAIPVAKRLVADEAALDNLFITHTADLASIQAASDKAAQSESALRVIHLKYHLAMVSILTADQIAAYTALGSHPEKGSAQPAATQGMADMPDMPGMTH
ncbi:MAG TPA: Spy/CpxP family protein refolding chaperone [Rhizomicrobium sp.]|jgi:Spy/CpxP family protein refolding chaperone|nr:Spy/CpxP family protein refolding chaperone [Rhizomicrobium sp.]